MAIHAQRELASRAEGNPVPLPRNTFCWGYSLFLVLFRTRHSSTCVASDPVERHAPEFLRSAPPGKVCPGATAPAMDPGAHSPPTIRHRVRARIQFRTRGKHLLRPKRFRSDASSDDPGSSEDLLCRNRFLEANPPTRSPRSSCHGLRTSRRPRVGSSEKRRCPALHNLPLVRWNKFPTDRYPSSRYYSFCRLSWPAKSESLLQGCCFGTQLRILVSVLQG